MKNENACHVPSRERRSVPSPPMSSSSTATPARIRYPTTIIAGCAPAISDDRSNRPAWARPRTTPRRPPITRLTDASRMESRGTVSVRPARAWKIQTANHTIATIISVPATGRISSTSAQKAAT